VLQGRIIIATEPTPEFHWSESTSTITGWRSTIRQWYSPARGSTLI